MTDGSWWVHIQILSALGERTLRCVLCWGSQNLSKKMTNSRRRQTANDNTLFHNISFIGSFPFLFSLSQINMYPDSFCYGFLLRETQTKTQLKWRGYWIYQFEIIMERDGASPLALVVKNSPAKCRRHEDTGSIPESGRSLKEGMVAHSSILAWRIPQTEKPGRLQSTGLQRVGHNWRDFECMERDNNWPNFTSGPSFHTMRKSHQTINILGIGMWKPWMFGHVEGK